MSAHDRERAAPLRWSDRLLLGYEPLDQTHQEFVELVGWLREADDAALPIALDAFIAHAQAHFSQEEQWMHATGFPSAQCHIDEHAQVLDSALQVRERLAQGNTGIARELGQSLALWFPPHADYMDAALAQWMVRRQHGGVPVVLRRNLKSD